MANKTALGRGMSALLGDVSEPFDQENNGNLILNVPIEQITANPEQPRKTFEQNSLNELAASIAEKGIIQPIIVEKENDRYNIIAGERRYRASKIAGLKEIPVIIKNFELNEKLEIALIENIQREDLNPIEEAIAYKDLMERGNLNQEEIAKKVGKNRSTVANSLRLLKLPENIRAGLATGSITAGHARAILSLNTKEQMLSLYREIINFGLSVREAESYAGKILNNKIENKKYKVEEQTTTGIDAQLKSIQEQFIDKLGTKVNISGSLQKGKVEISYYSMEDLERIFEIIIK